ncbi:MAG: HepT-like ribonuclease domain-containing protein [Acidobacteriota bacterium]
MSRDYKVYLDDILESIAKIERYTEALSYEQFVDDELRVDAVIRNLEVVGEAAKKIPSSLRDAHSGVEWQRVAGLRDILIHEYFGVDLEIIWDIIQNKLPPLKDQIGKMMPEEG